MMRCIAAACTALLLTFPAGAQDFANGPVFADFGPHAAVEGVDLPADTELAVDFDVSQPADAGSRNRGIESAARFINMHVANGVDPDNIRVAIVVHGAALRDLLTDEAYAAHDFGEANASAPMVRAMLDEEVRVIVCGQSAAGSGLSREEFLDGVEISLSAMTAHALLQQRGYPVNPF
ncbi:DsrE family protein [Aurantiacibacter spongiae]|uniref:Uncharacterized protein n=1 Tax=Aurantiacibacter spongiae TaxID=2488860 RepID=A0A3N5CRX3_9SPHN|nr:DsrE family protein [Aurantiacibacter spongiae]RPF71854.1 hypothetical protein EG799_09650 [Aurantiacibacter spongiae]